MGGGGDNKLVGRNVLHTLSLRNLYFLSDLPSVASWTKGVFIHRLGLVFLCQVVSEFLKCFWSCLWSLGLYLSFELHVPSGIYLLTLTIASSPENQRIDLK